MDLGIVCSTGHQWLVILRPFVRKISGGVMQYVALLIIHVYIVIGRSEMGDVSMCRYRRYMYIWSPATVYADDNIC